MKTSAMAKRTDSRQGLLPISIETTENSDGVTARAGLFVVLETMMALGLRASIGRHLKVQKRNNGLSDADKIEAQVLLMADGGDCIDDLNILRSDDGFVRMIGHGLPTPSTQRNFLYAFHDERLIEAAKQQRAPGELAYIPAESEALQGLARVNVDLVHRVAAAGTCTKATLDHDATVMESHKKEALAHYKGGRGYQPAVIYWGEQDLVLADEYRDGNVPAGMKNLPLIKRGFAALPSTVTDYSFRADTACYEDAVLKWLSNPQRPNGPKGNIAFTISADMTPQLRAICETVPESLSTPESSPKPEGEPKPDDAPQGWLLLEDRPDETVMWADVEFTPGDWPKDADPLRYVALRIRKKQGQLFASGFDTKYLAVVSNRKDISGPKLVHWHWLKAGTIEHVHDVSKNELAAGTPPCGRFGANAAWYRMSMLTYNVLSAVKSLALPSALSAARPKRLRYSVFTIPGRIISHAGRLVVRISHAAEQIAGLLVARARLVALGQQMLPTS